MTSPDDLEPYVPEWVPDDDATATRTGTLSLYRAYGWFYPTVVQVGGEAVDLEYTLPTTATRLFRQCVRAGHGAMTFDEAFPLPPNGRVQP